MAKWKKTKFCIGDDEVIFNVEGYKNGEREIHRMDAPTKKPWVLSLNGTPLSFHQKKKEAIQQAEFAPA